MSAPPPSHLVRVGETVLAGKYEIVGLLGSGGMGEVYEALQVELARPVAIKLLNAKIANDPVVFRRFRREAAALASLGHPNIVHVIEFSAVEGAPPLLVMEKLDGTSLKDVLREGGPMPPGRAVLVALQILSALAATHRAGIVHRDIKPGNVIVLQTLAVPDFVKLIDFGIAKVDAEQLSRVTRTPLTAQGEVVGTLAYMAPEQAAGNAVDGRADLFSVGCILFEAISGQRARRFDAVGGYSALFAPCRRLCEAAPSVDPRLGALVDQALELDPSRRFPSAEAMAAALSSFAPRPATQASTLGAPSLPSRSPTDVTATTRNLPAPAGPGPTFHATQASALAPGSTYAPAPVAPALAVGRATPPLPAARPLPARRSIGWVAAPVVFTAVALGGVALLLAGRDPSPDPPPPASTAEPPQPSKGPSRRPTSPPATPGSPADESAPTPLGIPACDAYIEYAFHRCDHGGAQSKQTWRGVARDYHERIAKIPRAAWGDMARSCKEMEQRFQEAPISCTN